MKRVLGHYELQDLLGAGAMGRVYRARDLQLERTVAVKLIAPGTADPAFLERFRREAKLAAQLNHPNIATIHALGEDQGEIYLVFEYVDGETLESALQRGPLSFETVRRIGMQAATALAEAHGRDIVHRDIKPGNLMLARSGALKVMDFGIARRASDATLTAAGSVVGTPKTMAPETLRGAEPGPPADLFSLGCVLYEALAGREPFAAADTLAVLYRIANEDPPSLRTLRPDVPPDLATIVEGLLAKDPARRLGPAGAVARALEACDCSPCAAPSRPASEPASMRKPRLTWRRLALGGLVLAAVGLTYGILGTDRGRGAARLRAQAEADRALAILERYPERGPTPAESLAAAQLHASRAVALDSTLANGWRALAWAADRREDVPLAQRALGRVLAIDPTSAPARRSLAETYMRQGRLREAEAELRALLRADSTSAADMRMLVQTLLAQREYGKLQAELRTATRRWPEEKPMWDALGAPHRGRPSGISVLDDPGAFANELQTRIERARVVAESLAIHGVPQGDRPARPVPPVPPHALPRGRRP